MSMLEKLLDNDTIASALCKRCGCGYSAYGRSRQAKYQLVIAAGEHEKRRAHYVALTLITGETESWHSRDRDRAHSEGASGE